MIYTYIIKGDIPLSEYKNNYTPTLYPLLYDTTVNHKSHNSNYLLNYSPTVLNSNSIVP